ncbi:MAG: hypothetical protein JOZ92_07680 [Candidatus Dormibacteraeota bacterium]|nr:hypothetical protein [Candidatus Dormibacteraeota bacterium]
MSSRSAATVLVAGIVVMFAAGCAGAAILLRHEWPARRSRRRMPIIERERDLAGALGLSWTTWVSARVLALLVAVSLGVWSGVWILTFVAVIVAIGGVRFAVAGSAARRRLRAERAFMTVLRELRDRIAVSNQSLDTALIEIARTPPRELQYILQPLAAGGDITLAIVECGERAHSPVMEQAFGVLLWARTRSLDALITAIDQVMLPVGEAQLAVEEEALVTLSQQRAVTLAMAALMLVMFVSVLRVSSFRAYYQTATGSVVVLIVVLMFALLIALVSRLGAVAGWTRWDLRAMAAEETPDRV